MLLICIYQCDNCSTLAPLKTTADFEYFIATWHDGVMYQFCAECLASGAVTAQLLKESEQKTDIFEISKTLMEKPDVALIN